MPTARVAMRKIKECLRLPVPRRGRRRSIGCAGWRRRSLLRRCSGTGGTGQPQGLDQRGGSLRT